MSAFTVEIPRDGEERELKALWSEVFGDPPELVDAFFRLLYKPQECRVARLDGEIISAGYCVSGAQCGEFRIHYVYAMATKPQRRSLGAAAAVGRELIAGAFSSGADAVATLPASETLTRWYENKLGMRALFHKGGDGVSFPRAWHDFAEICGEHSPDTPGRLYVIERDGVTLPEAGWELTFD